MADTPKAPDPVATAAAQAKMNRETAVTQTGLNAQNQYTPQGSLVYSENGKWSDGTPRFSATQSLSPQEQAIYDLSARTRTNMGNIGVEQSDKIRNLLGTNVDLSNEAVESRLFDLGSKRLNPQFAERESQMRQDLLNRGIREGSPAFESEMTRFNQSRNDAFNELALRGRGQSVQEILAARNQPLNEISALMSGSQVSTPNFVGTPQSQVSGVDYAGLVANNYNQQVASQNAMLGGLAGLGGSLAGAGARMWAASDRRLKTDIKRVGTLDNGLDVYRYRFKDGGPFQIGLLADEVGALHPEAVREIGGYYHVDYDLAVEGG